MQNVFCTYRRLTTLPSTRGAGCSRAASLRSMEGIHLSRLGRPRALEALHRAGPNLAGELSELPWKAGYGRMWPVVSLEGCVRSSRPRSGGSNLGGRLKEPKVGRLDPTSSAAAFTWNGITFPRVCSRAAQVLDGTSRGRV
jgi:hypothetical protein